MSSGAGDRTLPVTERTRVRRSPERAVADRDVLNAVLDDGLLAHIGLADESGQPFVIPIAYGRDGDRVLIHGSTGSRLFRALASGAPACFAVTHIDGLVFARSAFESSMNYRSVVALGRFTELTGADKERGLDIITDRLFPGRVAEVRANNKKELAATMVLALDLSEASVKVRTGGPEDADEDLGTPVWAGQIPLRMVASDPIPADDDAIREPLPQSVLDVMKRFS